MSVADEPLNEDLTTFATRTREERSRQAKKQARDRYGRWISVGASVQWRANGVDYAGKVDSLENDNAIISVKNSDNSDNKITVSQKELKVTTSKATLSEADVPKMAAEDNTNDAVHRPEFNKSLDLTGTASVKRDDGYIIEAQKEVDTDGNPIMYQLYAPNGRSLGIYGAEALGDFERMIAEDKATGEDKILDENGDIVPVTPELPLPGGPVAASGQVVRIARDHSAIIVCKNNTYSLIEIDSGNTIDESDTLTSLTAGGSWRKALPTEKQLETHLVSENDVEFAITSLAQYRVPNAVKEAITAAITSFDTTNISDDDLEHIHTLAHDDLVSLDSIKWINQFFSNNENPEKLHGGYQGKKWATKILSGQTEEEHRSKTSSIVYDNFDDDIFVYFGVGKTEESGTAINSLMSVDLETDAVYEWNQGKFNYTELSTDDIEAPTLIVLDAESAKSVAKWIDIANGETVMDVLDIDPEERNLFSLAYPELDFEEIDRVSAIIADATGYSPAERSVNAQRQKRGPGGKFGGAQVEQSSTLAEGIVKKATLNAELPLVQDVGQMIKDWLLVAEDFGGVIAAGELFSFSPEDLASFADITEEDVMPTPSAEAPAEAPAQTTPEEQTTTESDSNSGNILYFAIVDPVDKTAVTDVVALIKQNSQPAAWLRSGGTWVKSSEKLSDLQSATPPPVVKLDTPEPVKTVLSQIDSYDTEKGVKTEEMPIAASGCSLFDGTLTINNENDLVNSVFTIVELPDSEYSLKARYHIRKRARALNRMDLVPTEWRELSLTDIGTIENSSSPLYGEYGEVIIAAGVKGIADTPSDFRNVARLKNYWAFGRGAAKIRWGTPGDLTRAHRYLAKYVGPMRAWGLAQNLHKMVMGVSNITHDRATGQYKGRGKKR
jgi:hypothetical protein